MAISSAQKQARTSLRRQERNKSVRSQVKTKIGKAEKLISAGEVEAARQAVNTASTSLDKASAKRVLHPNNAARRKSRLVKKLNAASAAKAAVKTEPAA